MLFGAEAIAEFLGIDTIELPALVADYGLPVGIDHDGEVVTSVCALQQWDARRRLQASHDNIKSLEPDPLQRR